MLRERLLSNQAPSATFNKQRTYEDVLDLPDDQLRGISLTTLLAGGAKLFARHGAAAREDPHGTFALSEQRESLHYFCSHSWGTSRWLKYAALLVHFNVGRALIAMLIANFACVFVSQWYSHLLPSWLFFAQPVPPDNALAMMPNTAELMCTPVFVVVLCVAHRFSPPRSLFLDIACIRQDSDAAKADGIAALGAILDRSQRMLVLCDANYFARLWCTFELAAYTRREGSSRIDLLPLHEALVMLSVLFDMLLYMTLGALSGIVAPNSIFVTEAFLTPIIMTVLHVPATLFVVVAQVEACHMRSAVERLGRFKLEEARCQSDKDREELLQLIAKWFTERVDDGDSEYTRRVGFHRFETYVRHAVAPSLVSGRAYYVKVLLGMAAIMTAPLGDYICSEAFTPNHGIGLICFNVLLTAFMVPFMLFAYRQVAILVVELNERRRWPTVLAYTIGVLLNSMTMVGWYIAYLLTSPIQILEPDYKLPQDGVLDSTGRKLIATNLHGIMTGLGVMAVAGIFKI